MCTAKHSERVQLPKQADQLRNPARFELQAAGRGRPLPGYHHAEMLPARPSVSTRLPGNLKY